MGKLDDKSVLITGADSGIGKAVALLLLRKEPILLLFIIQVIRMLKKQNQRLKTLEENVLFFREILMIMNFVRLLLKKPFQPLEKLIF